MRKLVIVVLVCCFNLSFSPSFANQNYQLKISYKSAAAAKAVHWRLQCRPAAGNHPAAKLACTELKAAVLPFKKPPKSEICTKIYGGEQTAIITGRWAGAPIKRKFTRTDGCEMARWDQLALTLSGANS